MSKILNCCRCKTEVGEMNKGKIKTDAVVLCGKCIDALNKLEEQVKRAYSSPAAKSALDAFNSLREKIK